MEKSKSVVAIAKESSAQESVTKVFDLLGGVEHMIEKGSTVVIKPNAGHAAPPESAVCTSPEVVRAVIREVKKAKPRKIVIAEAAAVGCDTMECFKISGIQAVAEEEGIELIDIKSDKDLINVPVRGYHSNISHVKLPRFLLEAEHIINLPILKTHASMVFSGALKNIKGVVQDAVHLQMHQQNLTMAMMDVWYAVRADINIMDAIVAAGGYSPHTPSPREIGCILGSYDPVALDRVACEMVGIGEEEVSYFKVADFIGMGSCHMDCIDVIGEKLEDVKTKLWVPYIGDMKTRWPEYDIFCEGACSSCQAMLALNMETLKAIGDYDKRKDTIVVVGGKNQFPEDIDKKRSMVLHGNCTRKYLKQYPDAMFLPGCPPGEVAMYLAISDDKVAETVEYARGRMEKDRPSWLDYVEHRAKEFYGEE